MTPEQATKQAYDALMRARLMLAIDDINAAEQSTQQALKLIQQLSR